MSFSSVVTGTIIWISTTDVVIFQADTISISKKFFIDHNLFDSLPYAQCGNSHDRLRRELVINLSL